MKNLLLLGFLLTNFILHAQKKPSTDLDKKIKEFDTYVQAALKQWEVPGAGVAVVKDGKVIYLGAFGTRDLNSGAPANTETLFSIGSTTKAMTAVCLGILVDEGKLAWNDPVINYLTEFQLYEPYVTKELKIRDLLLHNSGVGNTDFLWGSMKPVHNKAEKVAKAGKAETAVNGHMPDNYLEDLLPQLPEAEELSAEDEAFLDAIVAKEKKGAQATAVSFAEFKNLVQKKAPDTSFEEEHFTEALLNELLKDSFTNLEEEQLSVDALFADPELDPHGLGSEMNNINKQAVKTTVRKLLNWVDESASVIGKDPTKQAISMYVRAGDLSTEMREALMRLVDSSHAEPATEKAGIRQIIDTLGELNDILDHHTPEYLNNVMALITEVNFG